MSSDDIDPSSTEAGDAGDSASHDSVEPESTESTEAEATTPESPARESTDSVGIDPGAAGTGSTGTQSTDGGSADPDVADLAAQLAAAARSAARASGEEPERDDSDSLWMTDDDDDAGYTVVRRSAPGWAIGKWAISAVIAAAVVVLSFIMIPRLFTMDQGPAAGANGTDPAPTSIQQPAEEPKPLTYSERIIASGPEHYWKFEMDQAGADTVGGGQLEIGPDANLLGSSAYQGGAGALDCVGTTGSRGISTLAGSPDGDFSVEVWINTVSPYGGPILTFGNRETGVSTQIDRVLYMATNGRVYFGTFDQNRRYVSSPTLLNNGQWHHIVGTMSGADGLALYVNGEQVGIEEGGTSARVFEGYWRVCGDNTWGWPGNSGRAAFTGSIDEVAIYTRTLTAGEVAEHYKAAENG